MKHSEEFTKFCSRVSNRLNDGEKEYQGSAMKRPKAEIIAEIQEELEDVFGWSFWLWTRLENMKSKMEELENQ